MNAQLTALIAAARQGEYTAALAVAKATQGEFDSVMEWFKTRNLAKSASYAVVDGVRFELTAPYPAMQFTHDDGARRVVVMERHHSRRESVGTRSWTTWSVIRCADGKRAGHGSYKTFEEAARVANAL